MNIQNFNVDENNLTIIDIRDYNSFSQVHIDNAIHVEDLNIDSFINKLDFQSLDKIFDNKKQ
mgnify:CR=1 FL=1